MTVVSVAIPVRDGGPLFESVLRAVAAQQVDADVEVVVLDSGSRDRSPDRAAALGARVERIPPERFSHGFARNELMRRTEGELVAFLSQDAVPAGPRWLALLLEAMAAAPDVAVACGPYRPLPDARPWTRRELAEFFASIADGDAPRVVRAADLPRSAGGRPVPSPLAFHTDANGCVARAAWRDVPFRDVTYAEDQLLALDLLDAGYAKAFHPLAAVNHSHDYSPVEKLRRTFDEFRALGEVYGHRAAVHPRVVLGTARVEVARDRAYMRAEGISGGELDRLTIAAASQHLARGLGAALGTRAERLPAVVQRHLSLERRTGVAPVEKRRWLA
jgi:glycosyltransferase involved in cell wall biosynthesis